MRLGMGHEVKSDASTSPARAGSGVVVVLTLAATALLLISLTWSAPNPLGAQVFCLLFAMRLEAITSGHVSN